MNEEKRLPALRNPSFRDYLSNHRCVGEGYTHVWTDTYPRTRLTINSSSGEFWDSYNQSVSGGEVSHLSERVRDIVPVVGEFEFKVDVDDILPHSRCGERDEKGVNLPIEEKVSSRHLTRLHSASQVISTVKAYQKVLSGILEEVTPGNLVCVVLEYRKCWNSTPYIRSGFCVQFPKLFLGKIDFEVHLLPRLRNELKHISGRPGNEELKIRENDDSIPLTMEGCLISKSITAKEVWPLYGSQESEKMGPYVLSRIYNHLAEAVPVVRELDTSNLPRALSTVVGLESPVFRVRTDVEYTIKSTLPKIENANIILEGDKTPKELLKTAKELLLLISALRAAVPAEWLDIGWALYCIGDGSVEALEVWIGFSTGAAVQNNLAPTDSLLRSSSSSDSECKCIYEWSKMTRRRKGIATLEGYARIDSKERFSTHKEDRVLRKIKDCIQGSQNDIAKLLYDQYGDRFVCTSIKSNRWFEFSGHRWKRVEEGVTLSRKISKELSNIFRKKAIATYNSMLESIAGGGGDGEDGAENERADPGDEYKKLEKKHKELLKLIKNLNESTFKGKIMRECREVFWVENFETRLDVNTPYLLGFENGVYDLKERVFRAGKPEDMATISTGYDLKLDFREGDEEVLLLDDFLMKIFPDPVLRKYYLEHASLLLVSGNIHKEFVNYTGEGNNGKSCIIKLYEHSLGKKYVIKLPTSSLTGKRTQSSQACPEKARCRVAKLVITQEASKREQINEGIVKEFTGNDSFFNRSLYEEGEDITPQFKLLNIVNDLPRIDSDDPALWNRTKVLPFEAKFLHESLCPATREEQFREKKFPIDPKFDPNTGENLLKMKQVFMWKLITVYHEVQRNGRMPEPDKVKQATTNYREKNDILLQFINEKLIRDELKKDDGTPEYSLTIDSLFSHFKMWFKASYSFKVPDKQEIQDGVKKKWGSPLRGGRWFGYRLRMVEDDVADGKSIIVDLHEGNRDGNRPIV